VIITADPINHAVLLSHPKSSALYSPMTMAASEALLHVDSQSLHPITNPA